MCFAEVPTQGKVLGGSTCINFAIWTRGAKGTLCTVGITIS